jgi:3-oxoadipate enol-lactonase
MPLVIVNGNVKLYYELSGPAGAPVVAFINGIWQDAASWTLAVRDLGPCFRTLAYDCRGQGQSDKPEAGPYDSETHARDLAGLLDALGIDRVHLVGLSMGGMVALHFAHLYPERAARLVLTDTFTHIDGVQRAMFNSWRVALEAGGGGLRFVVGLPWVWSAASLETSYDTIMAMKEKALRLPVYSSYHLIDGALENDARSWLGEIRQPALVINGEEDLMVPLYRARELQQALPGARLEIIPGGAHAAWLERPVEFNRAVLEFLQGTGEA